MIIRVTESMFHDAFARAGRATQFSYAGRRALYNYLTELEDDLGTPIELDVIGMCCEYTEATPEETAESYSVEEDEVLEFLQRHTTVIETGEDTIIYQEF